MNTYKKLEELVGKRNRYEYLYNNIKKNKDVQLSILENEIYAYIEDLDSFINPILENFKNIITKLEQEISEVTKDL